MSRAALAWVLAGVLLGGCGLLGADEGHEHGPGDVHAHGDEAAAPGDEAHDHDHEAPDPDHEAPDRGDEPHDHHPQDGAYARIEISGHEHGSDCVHLDQMAESNLGIERQVIQPRVYFQELKIPGVVQVDFDRQVEVSAPMAVRVAALDVPPHATVRPGQRLALVEIVDPQVRDLQISAVDIRAELLEATLERDRTRAYLDALSSAAVREEKQRVEADLRVHEARVRSRRSALDAALTSLEVAGLSRAQRQALEEQGTIATRVALHAPRLPGGPDMEVASRPVHLGQTIDAGEPLFELVAMDQLLVWGEAFEADLPIVRRAARDELPVTLWFPAESRSVPQLRVLSVEGALDGEDRVTHFFVRLPNRLLSEKEEDGVRYQDWENRAGSRVQVLVATEEAGQRFVLPVEAVIREGGRAFVYRWDGESYARVEVQLEAVDGRNAVIPTRGAVEAGDEVVVSGALALHLIRRQLDGGGQSADPHGHGHAH